MGWGWGDSRRRLHRSRRPTVVGGGGGATPARERWRGLAGEVQGGERNPFRGSIGAEEGRRVWFHGEPSLPAAMAWAAFLRASREGDGPFIGARWRGGGSGGAGKRSTGVGAAGEGAARRGVWLGHGNIVASRRGTGARVELGGTPGELVRGKPRGAGAVLGGGATRGAARWLRRRTEAARRPSAGRREVEEPASGNFVIRPKFQNPVL